MNYLPKLFAGLFIVGLTAGCANDNEEDLYPETVVCDTTVITYSGTVQHILMHNCYSCHSAATASGGIILDSYAEVKKQADNGHLLGAVSHASGYIPMPLGGSKLPACDIAGIKKWVESGAPNN